ncbi:LPS assembly protein LptD [Magnetospirillum moscoviense]|nr:LPS assembly protein LptD [Magnetospirillum moscoviense]
MRRLALIAVLTTPLTVTAVPALAVGAGEIGGWGDAWGEDQAPNPAPPSRPRATIPTAQPAAPVATPSPAPSPAPVQPGGWGQAWGEESGPAPAPARSRAAIPAARPVAPTAPMVPAPIAAPAPAQPGGWGQAWGDDAVPEPPQPRRATMPATAPTFPTASTPVVAAPRMPAASASDIRGWGDAWNDDTPAEPGQTNRPVMRPASAQPAAAEPETAAKAPRPMPPATQDSVDGDEAEEPVRLTADQIIHDRELGIVTAKGRVEVGQTGRTLIADTLSYNLKHDVMTASGNVTLVEPTGDTMFAEYFEMTGDLKDGVGKELRVLLSDRSRMAAASGIRSGGNRTDFDKAVYTACEPCRNKPDRRPLWEAKAVRITHDQEAQVIEYRDAWLELAGIPVAYTPYLSHPDPTVKRKSGLLAPTMGLSSTLGANITVPYFWAVADNQDVTFSPRFLFPSATATRVNTPATLDDAQDSLLQRVVLAANHRWTGYSGETKTSGSFTQDRHTAETRGHIEAEGRFDLDNTWRAGYQLQRTSDGTYNNLYGYPINSNRPWLTTRPYLEGLGRRNYAMVEAMAFQGLRPTDDDDTSPMVLPHAVFSHQSHPNSRGAYWTVDSDMLAYNRLDGVSARRLSSNVAWNRPFRGKQGDLTDVSVSLRGDGYHSDHLNENRGSATAGRVVPQVAANWRYPFVRDSATMPQIIEPMVMVAASPNGNNPRSIPNEDSLDSELDDVNILRANRKTGLDRVEGGLRGGYGLRWSAHPRRLGYVAAQVAQGWRAHADSTYSERSGFGDNLSDYVARFDYAPTGNISFLNRVRLDKDTAEVRRNETRFSIGSPILRADVSYYRFDTSESENLIFPSRQVVSYTLSSQMTRHWAAQASSASNLSDNGGPLGWTTRLIYSDECFAFVTNFRRSYIHDRDILAGYELTFNVVFRTLGDVPFNVF